MNGDTNMKGFLRARLFHGQARRCDRACVAQVFNLPYRRFPIGRALGSPAARGGLKTRDTADCKSALRGARFQRADSLGFPASISGSAFTLIELLVVMSIIFLLVSLVFPVTRIVNRNKVIAVAQTELNQMETAIENYKAQLGYYPPDNPLNPLVNPLFFELEGTILTNMDFGQGVHPYFVTIDGSSHIQAIYLPSLYNNPKLTGFANSSKMVHSTDEQTAAANFFKSGLKPTQMGQISVHDSTNNALLVCSVKWTGRQLIPTNGLFHAADSGINPWRYVSSNPTNNPGSYDLWVDLLIHAKTYRVSNWSQKPQQF